MCLLLTEASLLLAALARLCAELWLELDCELSEPRGRRASENKE